MHAFKRSDVQLGKRASHSLNHTLVFIRKQKNIDILEKALQDVSNPRSPRYGNYWSREQIGAMTANPAATATIQTFLMSHDIHIEEYTVYEDYLTASAPIRVWEDILDTEFFELHYAPRREMPIVRCLQYTLPQELEGHVESIFNTVQIPDLKPNVTTLESPKIGFVHPAILKETYNISEYSSTGNNLTSQAVYATLDQSFSPTDLEFFQSLFRIPKKSVSAATNGHMDNDACVTSLSHCIEANLDVQYIMAIAPDVPTTFYYWNGDDVWLEWITTVANDFNPPDVFSISYGSYEYFQSTDYLEAFNVEAIKLSLSGVTLVAATGDDGVAGFGARLFGPVFCSYLAMFPASSPYVTAVGGTMVRDTPTTSNTVSHYMYWQHEHY